LKEKKMKLKGFTLIEILIVMTIVGILLAIAVPNFIQFQCKRYGSKLGLNKALVYQVCENCVKCKNISSQEALDMIADGADPREFVSWKSNDCSVEETDSKSTVLESVGEESGITSTNDSPPESVERSWKD
jgi:prepilin-type N-terminal cleavage/methylation domain-containing protein